MRVDYALTPLGESLLPIMEAIKTWSEAHLEEVRRARMAYEGGQE